MQELQDLIASATGKEHSDTAKIEKLAAALDGLINAAVDRATASSMTSARCDADDRWKEQVQLFFTNFVARLERKITTELDECKKEVDKQTACILRALADNTYSTRQVPSADSDRGVKRSSANLADGNPKLGVLSMLSAYERDILSSMERLAPGTAQDFRQSVGTYGRVDRKSAETITSSADECATPLALVTTEDTPEFSIDAPMEEAQPATSFRSVRTPVSDWEMQGAVLSGDSEVVQDLLKRHADPNAELTDVSFRGLCYEVCSPLSLAAMADDTAVLRLLLKARAHPSSEYGFQAGALRRRLRFPTWFATAMNRDLTSLRELIAHGADIHHVAQCNNSNLMWQAAYNNNAPLVRFLIEQKVDMEAAAMSLDVEGASNTPLHAAARAGHKNVVNALLDSAANINVEDGKGHTIMEDVISHMHPDLVVSLMCKKGDLLTADGGLLSRVLGYDSSRVDPVMIAAVAKGLQSAPEQVARLHRTNIVDFLTASGDSSMHILEALFQPVDIRYWDQEVKHRKSVRTGSVHLLTTNAALHKVHAMTFATGPHFAALQESFLQKSPPPLAVVGYFMEKLAPAARETIYPQLFSQVQVYFCPVHNLLSLDVAMAIAESPTTEIFGLPGCQAIVNILWEQCRSFFYFELALTILTLIVLGLMTSTLPSNERFSYYDGESRRTLQIVFACFGCVLWVFSASQEAVQCVGYYRQGLLSKYMQDFSNVVDVARLLTMGSTFLLIAATRGEVIEGPRRPLSIGLLSLCIVWMWCRLVVALRAVRVVGLMILPILSAFIDVVAFSVVLGLSFCATLHAYLTLSGGEPILRAVMVVWRVMVFGDHWGAETAFEYSSNGDHGLQMHPYTNWTKDADNRRLAPEGSDSYSDELHAFFAVVSFAMSVTMLNIFIAVLSLSYTTAYYHAYTTFMRTRSGYVSDCLAWRGSMIKSAQKLSGMTRGTRSRSPGILPTRSASTFNIESRSYVWFALPVKERHVHDETHREVRFEKYTRPGSESEANLFGASRRVDGRTPTPSSDVLS